MENQLFFGFDRSATGTRFGHNHSNRQDGGVFCGMGRGGGQSGRLGGFGIWLLRDFPIADDQSCDRSFVSKAPCAIVDSSSEGSQKREVIKTTTP